VMSRSVPELVDFGRRRVSLTRVGEVPCAAVRGDQWGWWNGLDVLESG